MHVECGSKLNIAFARPASAMVVGLALVASMSASGSVRAVLAQLCPCSARPYPRSDRSQDEPRSSAGRGALALDPAHLRDLSCGVDKRFDRASRRTASGRSHGLVPTTDQRNAGIARA
jgi:hypothetical protein